MTAASQLDPADLSDDLAEVRDMVACVYMAAADKGIGAENTNALQTVLELIRQKLVAIGQKVTDEAEATA